MPITDNLGTIELFDITQYPDIFNSNKLEGDGLVTNPKAKGN